MMFGVKVEAGGLAVDGGGTRVAGSVSAR